MEENIIGGVSPIKARKMARGKSYGSGKRGTGDTRYKRDKWTPPASGGTVTTPSDKKPPNPTKPYVIKDGKVELTPTATAQADATSSSTSGTDGYWTYKDVTSKILSNTRKKLSSGTRTTLVIKSTKRKQKGLKINLYLEHQVVALHLQAPLHPLQ